MNDEIVFHIFFKNLFFQEWSHILVEGKKQRLASKHKQTVSNA